MQTNEATLAPTTPGPSERPNQTGAERAGPGAVVAGTEHATKVHGSGGTAVRAMGDVTVGLAAFKLLWYTSRRRHAHMTTRGLAAMPTVADAREVA